MKEISTISKISSIEPPEIFRYVTRLLGFTASQVRLEGKHYIHGAGEQEANLFVSNQSRRSHTLVLGTNGSGKTRLLETLIAQSIARNAPNPKLKREMDRAKSANDELRLDTLAPAWNSVFILDPKGDRDLRDRAYAVAKRFGREREFCYFSPTDDDVSFRLNPFSNYTRRSELANRVTALMPSGGDSEAFKAFAWRAINVVIDGLDFVREELTLTNLRLYIEGGVDSLLVRCLTEHLVQHQQYYRSWKSTVDQWTGRIPSSNPLDEDTARYAAALSSFYLQKVRANHPSTTIDALVDVLTHDSQHYAKLISNLIPILVQLTAGPMEVLLSKPKNSDDPRPITSFAQMIDCGKICYINLEALADSVISSALGSLFLADLTACAAKRHHAGISEPSVCIFVDEAAEMMNDPFIQALNKGRAAGFELTLASQTIADFEARMGSQAKASQVLGNINTLISMRLQDNASIDMVVEKFADTNYSQETVSKTTTTISAMEHRGRDYSGSVMKGKQTTDLQLINADLLSSLPPGHFFAHLPGGKKVKGRVLMMEDLPEKDRFNPYTQGSKSHPKVIEPILLRESEFHATPENVPLGSRFSQHLDASIPKGSLKSG